MFRVSIDLVVLKIKLEISKCGVGGTLLLYCLLFRIDLSVTPRLLACNNNNDSDKLTWPHSFSRREDHYPPYTWV